jgi:hypothetical protein
MNDERIRQLTNEVLAQLRRAPGEVTPDLEARVAALERAVRALEAGRPATAAAAAVVVAQPGPQAHPSLRLLDVSGGSDRCVLEPDRPCVQSGQCRRLGY